MTLDVFVDELRRYLMDIKSLNVLNLSQEILTDDFLEESIHDSVRDWNTTPPFTKMALDSFDENEIYLLKLKAAIITIDKYLFHQAHNSENYNDQGVAVNEFSRSPLYAQLKQMLVGEYEEKKKKYKYNRSVLGACGGVFSY